MEKKPEVSGKAASASAPITKRIEVEPHRPAEAAHLVDVLAVRHRGDDRAGRHEQQRLEEGVGHQVEHPGAEGADRDADHHVADLAHRRVGDRPLQVGHHQGDRARDQQRRQADEGGDVGGGRGEAEENVGAGDQVDAGGDHGRGVDQRGDRGRALHRVREPGVERQLGRLGEGAEQQQQADRDHGPLVGGEDVRGLGEDGAVVEGADLAEDQEGRQGEADVADHVDHERLHPRLGRRRRAGTRS